MQADARALGVAPQIRDVLEEAEVCVGTFGHGIPRLSGCPTKPRRHTASQWLNLSFY